ncbi:hypothetical protein RYH80_14740 [Halobaculum sp. MBLA0147]|uniref:DUF7344 domain-containing protein n=1 Tax=Halobaculum sp. MBLA0147 TaxID=3079934 RepID=UPI00352424BB
MVRRSGSTSETDGGGSTLDARLDETFASLAHPRRRHLLAELPESPAESLSLATAARRLRCREVGDLGRSYVGRAAATGPTESSDRPDTYVSLRHVHVPKLADANLVDYDTAADAVARTELTDAALSLVTRAERALVDRAGPVAGGE